MRLKTKYLVLLTWLLPLLLLLFEKNPNVSDLVKKADYDVEINLFLHHNLLFYLLKDIKNKYFTISDYNKFTNNILDAKITVKKLVNESGLNGKIKTLATKEDIKKSATKAKLKAEQDKVVKL